MAKGKRTGAGHKARYTAYKTERRWEKNRKAKLARALRADESNTAQITTAMGSIVYRRKTPKAKVWSSTKRKIASMFARYVGKCNMEIFHNNEKVSAPALMLHGKNMVLTKTTDKGMFSLATRLGGVWS